MKYYLFIDESGDHGIINIDKNFPVFVLCAVLISEDSYSHLCSDIKLIKSKYWKGKKVILHSRDIRKCDKEFQILFDTELKSNFYNDINNLITKHDYHILASAINKEQHIKKYGKLAENVYQIGLSFVIERAIFKLDDDNSASEPLQIIIEKRGREEDNQLKDFFNKLIQRGTFYVDRNRMKKHNLEIEFRSKKEDIDGLQLADLLAYPIARYVIDKERANPAFERLENKFYIRNNKNYGLKEFP